VTQWCEADAPLNGFDKSFDDVQSSFRLSFCLWVGDWARDGECGQREAEDGRILHIE
jgi:hypothetical protein